MARIKGVEVPDNKRVVIALTYIYGIGPVTAAKIVEKTKIDLLKRVKDLSSDELTALRDEVSNYITEGDLRREKKLSIDMKKEIGCYEGIRHRRGLPVRGQRTSRNCTNSKTAGKRKTVANKKK